MRSLEKRIASMEVQFGPDVGLAAELAKVFERITAALRFALPEKPGTVRLSACGKYSTFIAPERGSSFEEQVCTLHNRIKAKATTSDDRVVLDSMLADDLAKVGETAEGIIEVYARLINKY